MSVGSYLGLPHRSPHLPPPAYLTLGLGLHFLGVGFSGGLTVTRAGNVYLSTGMPVPPTAPSTARILGQAAEGLKLWQGLDSPEVSLRAGFMDPSLSPAQADKAQPGPQRTGEINGRFLSGAIVKNVPDQPHTGINKDEVAAELGISSAAQASASVQYSVTGNDPIYSFHHNLW
jgi:hypothetical protein